METPTKKRILYIITKSVLGGAQKSVVDLASAFEHEFIVAVAAGGDGWLKDTLTKESKVSLFTIEGLNRDIQFTSDITAFFSMLKIIREFKPDVVHVHSSKAAGLGALAARLKGVPKIIYTVHGWPFNEDRSFFQKKLIAFLSYLNCRLATDIIVLSEKEKSQIKNWPHVSKKIHVIPNGIAAFDFLSREDARRELLAKTDLSISAEGKWIGTIAELHANKGLVYSIKAFTDIKLPYLIIGEGEERSRLEASKSPETYLLGRIPDAKKFLKAFDIFVLPSIKEGLPYVLLEAAMAEVPVLATTIGGIPELIESGKEGLLVNPGDAKALTIALTGMLGDGDLSHLFAKNLKSKITSSFSFEKQLRDTRDLYVS